MVICCVPGCGTDSWKCDTSITFHDFPPNPDLAAKWIKQINIALKPKPMWFPRGRAVICSKHFLHTDFKGYTDTLRSQCVPTIFGHKYIGENPEPTDSSSLDKPKTSPLIVKVNKPQEKSLNDNSLSQTSDHHSHVLLSDNCSEENDSDFQETIESSQVSTHEASVSNSNHLDISSKPLQYPQSGRSNMALNYRSKRILNNQSNSLLKNKRNKKEKSNTDLIEIGPNTFLKINPEIIKVNKKLTPSGNTVLQFLMDQKHANSQSADMLPKLIQGASSFENTSHINGDEEQSIVKTQENICDKDSSSDSQQPKDKVVQHVLGHLVDTHVCEKSCADLKSPEEENISVEESVDDPEGNNPTSVDKKSQNQNNNNCNEPSDANASSSSTIPSYLQKAPMLLTTNMPISHCFMDKSKYLVQLKQKNRQIASLKFQISNLNKKIEELEDRCIVQERQLSYSFIKRLKAIRKNATKGDPAATYILEQIRSYTNNSKMRWSDSTLTQCGIWCRKAPYAYEYFKKAKLFNLPCLGTVKRFIKKHPELKFTKNSNVNCNPNDDDDSSSDFDFDESDNQNEANDLSEDESDEPVASESVQTVSTETIDTVSIQTAKENEKNIEEGESEESKARKNVSSRSAKHQSEQSVQNNICDDMSEGKMPVNSKCTEPNEIPLTVDSSNLELQEIILPSGEVVQCYTSSISNDSDVGNQYFIIPNVGDQNSLGDHEYSVVQADSLPVILQNLDHSQLHLQQQEQLIFIANSSDQVECSETEVTTA